MERLDFVIFIFEYGRDDRSVMARFEKCLDFDNYFSFYTLAILYSFRIARQRIYFNQYYFANYFDNDCFYNKINKIKILSS
jgi:hypothetical protein